MHFENTVALDRVKTTLGAHSSTKHEGIRNILVVVDQHKVIRAALRAADLQNVFFAQWCGQLKGRDIRKSAEG